MGLHHGHMLVRGRVVNRFHSVPAQHFSQTVRIADIAQCRDQLEVRILFPKLVLDPKEIAFRLIECNQTSRAEAGHLTAQLRTNGTRGASDQD